MQGCADVIRSGDVVREGRTHQQETGERAAEVRPDRGPKRGKYWRRQS
jgi:hypothetical protein